MRRQVSMISLRRRFSFLFTSFSGKFARVERTVRPSDGNPVVGVPARAARGAGTSSGVPGAVDRRRATRPQGSRRVRKPHIPGLTGISGRRSNSTAS